MLFNKRDQPWLIQSHVKKLFRDSPDIRRLTVKMSGKDKKSHVFFEGCGKMS